MFEDQRVKITVACKDAEYIPKVEDAGQVVETSDGRKVQTMHNGIRVYADGYYGPFITTIVEELGGHHEPQEEKAFFEVLKKIEPGSTMIELGSYWSYYSLWFQKAVAGAKNYMVEPETENLNLGKQNFEMNNAEGVFEHALVSDRADDTTSPPSVSVDSIIDKHDIQNVAILHSDIQGFERLMLKGAQNALAGKRIRFIFISTHGHELHQRCLSHLKSVGYHLIVEHTPSESFSGDGLIVASAEPEFDQPVTISHRSRSGMGFNESIRWSLFRMGIYDALSTVFSKQYPELVHRVLR